MLYLGGAARLADELRADAGGGDLPTPAKGHDWTKGLPPREVFVADRMRAQAEGGETGSPWHTAEQWGAVWDEMDAKLKAHQAE